MRLQSYLKEDPTSVYNKLEKARLASFNKEAEKIDKIIPKVKSQCKPWLSKVKSNPYAIIRGIRGASDIMKKKVRQDRKPLDTTQIEHEEIDKAFYDAFGWKPRSSGLFVTPDVPRGGAYGRPMVIFPIGKVKYLWSKDIGDLYFRLGQHRKDWIDEKGKSTLLTAPPEQGIKFAKKEQIFNLIISKYSETQITRALDTRTEIMLQCKEYWALPSDWCVQWLIWRESLAPKPVLTYRFDKEIYKQFMREAFYENP
jgi:hypothetical protein